MRPLGKLSLGVKLNLVVASILGGLLFAASILVINAVNNLTAEIGQQRIEQEVAIIQTRLGETENVILASVNALASSPNLIDSLVNEDSARIRTVVLIAATTYGFDDIDVVDADGTRIFQHMAGNVSTEEDADDSEDTLIRLGLLGIETAGVVAGERIEESELFLAAVAPVRDTSGSIIGAVVGSSELDQGGLDAINLSREGIDLALISEGEVIVPAGVEERLGLAPAESIRRYQSAINQALSGAPAVANGIIDVDGPHALAHIPLLVSGKTYGVIRIWVDVSELVDFRDQLITMLIVAFAVLGLVAMAAMGLFARTRITAPIRNLQRVAEQMASGDIDKRAGVTSNDEIGRLAGSFNNMADTLRSMINRERAAKNYLESTVAEYMEFVGAVAQGRLTTRLLFEEGSDPHETDQDALKRLGIDLNTMVENLSRIVQQVRSAAIAVFSAASEIQAAATQQTAAVVEQDAVVTQTVATVEEMRATVLQTAQRAQAVADSSQESIQVSRSGQDAVDNTVEGMIQIKERVESIAENILTLAERTQQIGDIIDTVNAMADQSKILALNASIEAARAGEEGKGFSVVAMEVRKLAEQSRAATTMVDSILHDIQQATNTTVMVTEEGAKQSESGMRIARTAGDSIRKLASTIETAALAASQIAASTHQQTNGMDQLAAAMAQIKQATAQTAASARQTEQGVRDLTDMARQLEQWTAEYQLEPHQA